MLLVKTTLGLSHIHGIGLFADEPIATGTRLWYFMPGFDFRLREDMIASAPEPLKTFLLHYGWKSKKSGLYCFASDDARFWNHSEKPNCFSYYDDSEIEDVQVAMQDISVGEELTVNYTQFDATWNRTP